VPALACAFARIRRQFRDYECNPREQSADKARKCGAGCGARIRRRGQCTRAIFFFAVAARIRAGAGARNFAARRRVSARLLLAFGFGYVAARLARRLSPAGDWRIVGTGRAAAADDGVARAVFRRDAPLDPALVRRATHVLVSIPPDEAGDPAFAVHAADLAAAPGLAWLGYLSTTGVYGDHGGAWVDEAAECRAGHARSRARLAAEAAWLDLAAGRGVPSHIFRLAGIYGPGRSALDEVRAGRARRIDKPGHVFSRIHVDDIVAVLAASMARPRPGAVYNVADDAPAPGHDVVAEAARRLGLALPPLVPYAEAAAGLSPLARSFYSECRRVANGRVKRELGVSLAAPDFRAGLALC
jgi:nucleoside-diphosphate-sugar epimerase